MVNEERFNQFLNARFQSGDWPSYISANRLSICRKKILKACQFSRSSLYQNPTIKKRLLEVENDLRAAGILVSAQAPNQIASVDESSLEEEAAKLKVRLDTLQVRGAEMLASMEAARHYIRSLAGG